MVATSVQQPPLTQYFGRKFGFGQVHDLQHRGLEFGGGPINTGVFQVQQVAQPLFPLCLLILDAIENGPLHVRDHYLCEYRGWEYILGKVALDIPVGLGVGLPASPAHLPRK